jgi:hypothetical protein
MSSCRRRSIVVRFLVTATLLVGTSPAHAQDEWTPPPHVRSGSPELIALVDQASRRSPRVRDLIDELEQSDVVVYLRFRSFDTTSLDGRLTFLSKAGGRRYVVVELACGRIRLAQIATLGHELQHAVEIARAPSVVDAKTMASHYARIGTRMDSSEHGQTFETQDARDTGTCVRREMLTTVIRSANGT